MSPTRALRAANAACCLSLALVAAACGYTAPTAPAATPGAAAVATTITLTSMSGVNTSAGQVFLAATVRDAAGRGMRTTVHFATSAGTMEPETMETGTDGLAQTKVLTSETATVTASSGSASGMIEVKPGAPPTVYVPPVSPLPLPGPPTGPSPPTPTPGPSPTPSPGPGPTPDPPPLFTKSGSGADHFDLPAYVARIHIVATNLGNCETFAVTIARRPVLSVDIGMCGSIQYEGTFDTPGGGVVDVLSPNGATEITWSFNELR